MRLESSNFDELYKYAAHAVLSAGEDVCVRGLHTKELLNTQLVLQNPRLCLLKSKARALDFRYLIGELCFFLSGSTDLAFISHYSKFWNSISDDGVTVNSAYGFRLFAKQLSATGTNTNFKYALACLIEDKTTRKAVMTIYDARTDSKKSGDNPCTMYVQFIIRNNALNMIVNMRSNDIWLGLPYDMPFFALVQEMMLITLRDVYPDLQLGWYEHNAMSFHAYARHYESLEKVAYEPLTGEPLLRPCLSAYDVASDFNYMLNAEFNLRMGCHIAQITVPTPFQTWAISHLK
jgi:thymidylate synthase